MDHRFDSDEWDRLTPTQRIDLCRLMADESRKLSARATPELERIYLNLADQWSALASQFEKATKPKN